VGKRSASAKHAFTRSVKRGNIDGRPKRGGSRNAASTDATRQLLFRLRRVELAVTVLSSGKPRYFDLDSFVKSVLQLDLDASDDQGRRVDEGGKIPVPQKGTPEGESA